MSEKVSQKVAAIDLGSNSFHVIVAAVEDDQHLKFLDRHSVKVRLGLGLDANGNITEQAWERGFDCLKEFAQLVEPMPEGSVRILGTNTLRKAKNGKQFVKEAQQLLGHRVNIISGQEEARLVYLGVAHTLAANDTHRLVVDIGGGSTEVIIGKNFKPMEMESLAMGCIAFNLRFFPKQKCDESSARSAIKYARGEALKIHKRYKKTGWTQAVGASGSVKAIYNVIKEEYDHEGITYELMEQLLQRAIESKHFDNLAFKGINENRKLTFVSGLCILMGLFEQLKISDMMYSDGALREGALYELIGRINHEDVRETTVAFLQQKNQIDLAQANRVKKTAGLMSMEIKLKGSQRRLLDWACDTHELGLSIARSGYHHHGAYIVEYADLPGFSQQEQYELALLIDNQRKSLKYNRWPEMRERRLLDLVIMLRLSVLLHRDRNLETPNCQLKIDKGNYFLKVNRSWLKERPLTQADLAEEQALLQKHGISFEFTTG